MKIKLFAKVLYLHMMKIERKYNNYVEKDEDEDKNKFEELFNIDSYHYIVVDIMSIRQKQLPVFLIFRALGIESDKEIINHILNDDEQKNPDMLEMVRKLIIDCKKADGTHIYTQNQALSYLKKYTQFDDEDYVKYVLLEDFLPNMDTFQSKAIFFGYLINQMIKAKLGIIQINSRDNYMNKRVDVSGVLLTNVFRDFYNKFRNNVIRIIDKNYSIADSTFAKNFTTLYKNLSCLVICIECFLLLLLMKECIKLSKVIGMLMIQKSWNSARFESSILSWICFTCEKN